MVWEQLVFVKVGRKFCASPKHLDLVHSFLREELLDDRVGYLKEPVDLNDEYLTQPFRIIVLYDLDKVGHELQVLVSSSHPGSVKHHHESTVT